MNFETAHASFIQYHLQKKIRGMQRSLGTWTSGSGEAILPQRLVVSSIEF
ncbi:hypothetical protein NSQ29_09650 [Paenibacillus sp. FSL F4-0236]